jgi:hypothetical protein
MDQPSSWELFQNIVIGIVAGVIASGVVNRGMFYVAGMALVFWVVLVVTFFLAQPLFEWIEDEEVGEGTDGRPYQDTRYAS